VRGQERNVIFVDQRARPLDIYACSAYLDDTLVISSKPRSAVAPDATHRLSFSVMFQGRKYLARIRFI